MLLATNDIQICIWGWGEWIECPPSSGTKKGKMGIGNVKWIPKVQTIGERGKYNVKKRSPKRCRIREQS